MILDNSLTPDATGSPELDPFTPHLKERNDAGWTAQPLLNVGMETVPTAGEVQASDTVANGTLEVPSISEALGIEVDILFRRQVSLRTPNRDNTLLHEEIDGREAPAAVRKWSKKAQLLVSTVEMFEKDDADRLRDPNMRRLVAKELGALVGEAYALPINEEYQAVDKTEDKNRRTAQGNVLTYDLRRDIGAAAKGESDAARKYVRRSLVKAHKVGTLISQSTGYGGLISSQDTEEATRQSRELRASLADAEGGSRVLLDLVHPLQIKEITDILDYVDRRVDEVSTVVRAHFGQSST